MRNARVYFFLCLFLSTLPAIAGIKIIRVSGDVTVRHDVQETWTGLSRGDILQARDAIRSGRNSSVTLLVDGAKKIVVPELVVLDLSDLRSLTQEELLLKLAMEGVRAAPQNSRHDGELNIPRTTTTYGEDRDVFQNARPVDPVTGTLQSNGIKVLYQNGFYATCVVRAKQLFRLNTALLKRVDDRLLVASAFEMMNLRSEALDEYRLIQKENLPPDKKAIVESKVKRLKKEKKD